MGCLFAGLAGLLALAVPASIAPSRLVGALIVLAVLAVAALAAVQFRTTRAAAGGVVRDKRVAEVRIVGLAIGYAAVVIAIHLLAG